MKVGSLVIVVGLPPRHKEALGKKVGKGISWLPTDDSKTIYTIRRITPNDRNEDCALLEEGKILPTVDGVDVSDTWGELSIPFKYLREIQPPNTVEVDEIVKESLKTVCPN